MSKLICPFTDQEAEFYYSNGGRMLINYSTPATGKVIISDIAFPDVKLLTAEQRAIIAGICRNRSINNEQPLIIYALNMRNKDMSSIPMGFEARARHLLSHLYKNGEKGNKEQSFKSSVDSFITYTVPEEFESIMNFLEKAGWIKTANIKPLSRGNFYERVIITKPGIAEIGKELPGHPMHGLLSQEIMSGNQAFDGQIAYARKLFFAPGATENTRRAACDALCNIAAPLKNELQDMFPADKETFFSLLNNFNIAQFKAGTKVIEHEEQLEWVYYSLLNTISACVKIKMRRN